MLVMDDNTLSITVAATQLSRQQIMQATASSLRHEGYDATTIRRIASRLDCAVGSIYRYFQDKRDLLDAVAQGALDPVIEMIDAGSSAEESARLYHDIASDDPALYRLMFWITAVGLTSPDPANPGNDFRAIPAVISRIIAGWSHRLGDEPLAHRYWITLHGCLMLGMDWSTTLATIRSVSESRPVHAVKETLASPPRTLRAALPNLAAVVMTATPASLRKRESIKETVAEHVNENVSDESHSDQVEVEPVEDVVLL